MEDDRQEVAGATYEGERRFALRVARQAGQILLEQWGRITPDDVRMKGVRDPVTATDLASEAFVAAAIRSAYPDDGVLAEEQARHRTDARRLWIVDPLDGTVNFTRGHPFVSVSIALVEDGAPVAGAIVAPALGDAWSAAAGGGAWRHRGPGSADERCRVSPTPDLDQAIAATGFPYVRDVCPFDNLQTFGRMYRVVRGLRRCGVASIDLALVASGVYDLFWEAHLEPHDVAAGALLVQEAGGRLSDYTGGDDWLYGRNLVASNAHVHDAALPLMDEGFDPDARR